MIHPDVLIEAFEFYASTQKVSHCHLEVYVKEQRAVVVWTELLSNPGMSVTNAAEELADAVVELLKDLMFQVPKPVFIERYDARSYGDPADQERLSRVVLSRDARGKHRGASWVALQLPLQQVLQEEMGV
ncbi:hypothetical protein [Deinococcus roseus]|uniref:Uncharacterized protein n=1 Tax=Deinococcus roseus TaxID=392414 RepID=A0ABQ2D650_9DEIO|nr:hypothetical protein [Deinococcus roseus]GGJ44631.1 hypothetical protein GCM10008938_33510 [Deinococcus roseus]